MKLHYRLAGAFIDTRYHSVSGNNYIKRTLTNVMFANTKRSGKPYKDDITDDERIIIHSITQPS